VLVDARRGEILQRWSTAASLNQARVYEQNPVTTPTTTEVTLDADPSKPGLASARVVARNCIDRQAVNTTAYGPMHQCDLVPTATRDASGDFTSIVPAPITAPEDTFAELSIDYHASKAFAFAEAMGLTLEGGTAPLTAIANFRVTQGFDAGDAAMMSDGALPLAPYDNAFFSPGGAFGSIFGDDGDALWFGQGTRTDFSYDGDVVYHELGHFVVSRTLKLIGAPHRDLFGITYAPTAMNEGIADLFSCFITGDPNVGEFAAQGLGKGDFIRSLVGGDSFPTEITGEAHQDSLPFSQAIWRVYAALDATKRTAFREAMLKAFLAAPSGDLGYADLGALLETSLASALDDATADAVRDALAARGIRPGDARVLEYGDVPVWSAFGWLGFHAPGRREAGTGEMAPGIVQVHFPNAPTGRYTLDVSFTYRASASAFGASGALDGDGAFVPGVLVKVGPDPITFQYGPLRDDAQLTACDDDGVGGVTCHVPLDVKADAESDTTSLHLMVVNSGDRAVDWDGLQVDVPASAYPIADAGVPPGDADATSSTLDGDLSGGGCSYELSTTSSSRAGRGALVAAGLALIALRRRRR
jgi:MYXO-CTERM domain-containing protein